MRIRLVLGLSLLTLVAACSEEVGLIDEDSNFGGRGGNPLKTVMNVLEC